MPTVALFGDSTIHTYYLRAAENAALVTYHGMAADYDGSLDAQLTSALAALGVTATVTNFGRDGMDSGEALSEAYANPTKWSLVLASAPDVIVIGFAANDYNAGLTKAEFKTNIETMVTQAAAAEIPVALLTYWWTDDRWDGGWNTLAAWGQYADAMVELAGQYGLTLIDTRLRLRREIEIRGDWDLYGHNDDTWLEGWGNGSAENTIEHLRNGHPWIHGTELIADEMASRLVACETALGGSATYFGRSAGWTTGGGFGMGSLLEVDGLTADWRVKPNGYMKNVLNGVPGTNAPDLAFPVSAWVGGIGKQADFDANVQVTVPTTGIDFLRGTIVVVCATNWTDTTQRVLFRISATSGNANKINLYKTINAREVYCANTGSDGVNVNCDVAIAGIADGHPTIVAYRWAGTEASVWANGVAGTVRTVVPKNGLAATGIVSLTTSPFAGIHRMLFFDSSLSDAQLATLDAGLSPGVSEPSIAAKYLTGVV